MVKVISIDSGIVVIVCIYNPPLTPLTPHLTPTSPPPSPTFLIIPHLIPYLTPPTPPLPIRMYLILQKFEMLKTGHGLSIDRV